MHKILQKILCCWIKKLEMFFFVCAEFHTTLSRERSEEVSVELTLYFVSNKRINCFHSSAPGLVDRPNVEFRFRQCLLRMLWCTSRICTMVQPIPIKMVLSQKVRIQKLELCLSIITIWLHICNQYDIIS